jgi:hypothetical protein
MRWGSQNGHSCTRYQRPHPCTKQGSRTSRKEKALGGRLGLGVDRLRLSHGRTRLYRESVAFKKARDKRCSACRPVSDLVQSYPPTICPVFVFGIMTAALHSGSVAVVQCRPIQVGNFASYCIVLDYPLSLPLQIS